uniref:Uncharacterized protein n=1 Tax=Solanum tuberosum TaxID=4113 RepID=M1D8A8_SOLTU
MHREKDKSCIAGKRLTHRKRNHASRKRKSCIAEEKSMHRGKSHALQVFVESIQEDEFSNQTTGADDIKKDAAQRGTFLSSELGHSLKRSVKLLGREQRSDFHHNQTTPLSEGMWVYLWVCRFQFRIWKFFGLYPRHPSNPSDNAPRVLEIMSVTRVILHNRFPFQPMESNYKQPDSLS